MKGMDFYRLTRTVGIAGAVTFATVANVWAADAYDPQLAGQKFEERELAAYMDHGIARLRLPKALTKAELPLCVKNEITDKVWKSVAEEALARWNQLGQAALSHPVFSDSCSNPFLTLVYSETSGDERDGAIRFGGLYVRKEPAGLVIVLRAKEVREHGVLMDKLIATQLKDAPSKAKALAAFKLQKSQEMGLNLLMHELGHALGLAHNFNEAEASIMDYSTRTKFSKYDEDALRLVFGEAPQSKWAAKIEAPSGDYKGH